MDKMNVQQQIDKIVQKLSEDHPVALAMRNQRTVQLAQQYNQVKVEGRDPVVVDLGLMDEVNKGKHNLFVSIILTALFTFSQCSRCPPATVASR